MAGRTRRWVYEHAGILGAVPLGSRERPRLRFHLSRVRDYLSLSREVDKPEPCPVNPPLLPIHCPIAKD